MSRLPEGGLIDRSRPIGFRFDGRRYSGFAGDTLASALVANDVRLVGRSFKYHRPRGILTAGSEEPNALVTLNRGAWAEANARATTVPLVDGLEAFSQNRWPSLGFDLLAANDLLSPLLSAGFYYKTFMWPSALWERLYEPLIRRAAGLGRLPGEPDPRRYDRDHAFCDLLVVGAGPAGLVAAEVAASAGARVILVDEDAEPGGRLTAERHRVEDMAGDAWALALAEALRRLPNLRYLPRTLVFGAYDGMTFGAVERLHDAPAPDDAPAQRYWKIVARRAILATGAVERPIVFAGNDRPGVMMASAIQAYVNRFAAAPGGRVAIFTTADSGWAVARDLAAAGIEVAALIDPRGVRGDIEVPVIVGEVTAAHGAPIHAITVRTRGGANRRIRVDALGVSGGWNPAVGLGCNLGARPAWSESAQSFLLDAPPPGFHLAGAAAGRLAIREALASGFEQAIEALRALGFVPVGATLPSAGREAAATAPPRAVTGGKGKAFVDFQHDVTDADIALAAREGFRSVEHLKRYTTLGMATDQGRIGQVNGHALLAAETSRSIGEVGTVLSRPPYLPVSIGALAGHHRGADYRPVRLTPTHGWAVEAGASFVDAGAWRRARWFPREDDRDWLDSVNREVRAVRGAVGVCDVSTLGKIEVVGPDAGELLDRLYANRFSTLAVGRTRYGLMLREDGFVLDDGTASRLAEDRFLITTTTANAGRVMQHVEFALQLLWPGLAARAVSVTERWAVLAVAGPNARMLLERVLPDAALDSAALPHMSVCELRWEDRPARLFRLSFSGELGFELAVPADRGERAVRALMRAGANLGVTPYGVEALGVMRIEKGHVGGNELNGQTTACDLGMARMLSTAKDYVGATMARRAALAADERPQLVGLAPCDGIGPVSGGAHLIAPGAPLVAASDQGHVTSAAFSPTLGRPIALALLRRGRERHGERLRAVDPLRGRDVMVEVSAPVFVDPEGGRVHG